MSLVVHKLTHTTIDNIYKEILLKLTENNLVKDVSAELLALTQNDDKVLYVYRLLERYKLLPNVVQAIKSDNVSFTYRNLGNSCFKQNLFIEAWQYYNLSLSYSPQSSENYILALSNRSAVFVNLGKYKECLNDIELVLRSNYPNSIYAKLLKRKEKCEAALRNQRERVSDDKVKKETDDILKFKGTKHCRYLSASSKLSVNYSEDLGRHVVANEDIKVGEIIVHEKPFIQLLLKSQLFFACSYCFSRTLNLLPCFDCCFTFYCSDICRYKAREEYHQFECKLSEHLMRMNYSKLELLALRTFIKGLRMCKDNWHEFIKTIKDAESTVNTENWGHVRVDNEWVYDSKYYASLHTLATNDFKRDVSDMFQKCVSAAVLLNSLAIVQFLKTDDNNLKETIKRFAAKTILTHIMSAPTNMHGITTNVESADGNYVDEYNVGCGPYAFLSLINHSCSPNVVRVSKIETGEEILVALRPIKKGMQLFDNYGAHHATHKRDTRRGILKSQYKFVCQCEACIDDWPLYQNMKPKLDLPQDIVDKLKILNESTFEGLQKAEKKKALELFKPLCELVTVLEPYLPCKEAADCQEALKQCLVIFGGVVSKEYVKVVEWDADAIPYETFPIAFRNTFLQMSGLLSN